MRQSDGSEILGLADPRRTLIGIIHISPGDDRQSVITAITTQEKVGREQIILDLPAQNKAFKNAIDFEGLHKMASEIEATILLVIPSKSRIASLARRENFVIYASMDELTASEFPPVAPDEPANAPLLATSEEAPFPVEDDESDHTISFPLIPLPEPSPAPFVNQPEEPENKDSSESDVPEAPPPIVPSVAPPKEPEDESLTPLSPIPPGEINAEPEEKEPDVSEMTARPLQASPVAQDKSSDFEDEPTLILAHTPFQPASSTSLVPSRSSSPVFYAPSAPRRSRSWRSILIPIVILLLLIALGFLFYRPILDWIFPPSATIIIIPQSQDFQRTYQITATLGIPNPTKDQVHARLLYDHSLTRTQVTKATGVAHSGGQQAQGILVFYNTTTTTQTIPANTVIVTDSGVAVFTDDSLTLPPSNPAQSTLSKVSGSAHTTSVGMAQNLPASTFSNTPCCGSGTIFVSNPTAFSGGEDPQSFPYVQQSDIDGTVQSMEAVLDQQATKSLTGQIHSTEHIVGTPRCLPQVTSDHQAGDRSDNVMVTVTAICTGEVYDIQDVQTMATANLTQSAVTSLGTNYISVGPVLSNITNVTTDSSRNIVLTVDAQGIWTFQFTTRQRSSMVNLIAGKSIQDARLALLSQPGVKNVAITLTGVGVDTVPGDARHIAINVEAVSGLLGYIQDNISHPSFWQNEQTLFLAA